jgi:PAS domain S-box-containing protein
MPTRRIPAARRRDPRRVDPHVGTRVEAYVRRAELGPVAAALRGGRDQILRRWLEAARLQPCHAARPDRAVADHIPHLFDALVAFLERSAPREVDPAAPLDDQRVHESARAHAADRFAQGLGAADVLTEFRLLRQEIGRALREQLPGRGLADVVGAELLVHDALDGATTLALAALEEHDAERRRLAADVVRLGAEKDEAHALLDALFAAAPIGLASWDREFRYVRLNAAMADFNGLPVEAHLGRPVAEVLPALWPAVEALWRRVLETGEPLVDVEVSGETPRAPGVRRHWLASYYPVRAPAGGPVIGLGGVVVEVTARKAAEAEREALLGVLAHDLKTPLTVVKANADLLEHFAAVGRLEPGRVTVRAGAIGAAAGRMAAQIGELLDLARLRAGQPLELVRRPTDLVALAERVVADVATTAPGHAIVVEAAAPALVGTWDGFRLERALANLLTNAIKYSPAGGEVRVRVAAEDGPAGTLAALSVADRGIGVPTADLGRIFERFGRGGNAVGRFEGEGLGLAGVKQIVEQHGGAVAVESAEGQGSTFTIRLPLERPGAGPTPGGPGRVPG